MPKQIAIVLITSTPPNQEQEHHIRNVIDWMKAYKIDHKIVDGADEAQRELRNELFTISGLRGKYPQLFISNKTDTTTFVGGFEAIQTLVDNKDSPGVENIHTVMSGAKLE